MHRCRRPEESPDSGGGQQGTGGMQRVRENF